MSHKKQIHKLAVVLHRNAIDPRLPTLGGLLLHRRISRRNIERAMARIEGKCTACPFGENSPWAEIAASKHREIPRARFGNHSERQSAKGRRILMEAMAAAGVMPSQGTDGAKIWTP